MPQEIKQYLIYDPELDEPRMVKLYILTKETHLLRSRYIRYPKPWRLKKKANENQ